MDTEAEELMQQMEEMGTLAREGADPARDPPCAGQELGSGTRADLARSARYSPSGASASPAEVSRGTGSGCQA